MDVEIDMMVPINKLDINAMILALRQWNCIVVIELLEEILLNHEESSDESK